MSEVLVRYSYTAEQEDELSLKVGDVIRNVVTMDGGWWEGELNGKKGVFPDNFVEITKGNDKDEGEGTKLNHKASTKSHVAQLANKLKDGVHIGSTGAPKKRVSPHMKKKKQKAKVKHQYTAEHEDELSLEIDEVIDVIEKVEDGWMKGTLNGKQGLFPSNFVDLYEEDEETEKADEPKKEPEDEFKEIKGKKVQGVGLGNIFGSGPIKLKSTATITKRGSQHIDSESKDEKTAVNTEVARREKGQTTSDLDPLSVDVCSSSMMHSECTTLHADVVNVSAQASSACSNLNYTSTPNEHSSTVTNSSCYFGNGGLTNKLSDETYNLGSDIWPMPAPRVIHLRHSVEGGDSLANSIIPCTKPGKHTRCMVNFASGSYSMALNNVKSSSTPEIKSIGLEGKNIKSFLYGSPFFEGSPVDSQESIPGDVALNGHPITDSMILNKRRLSLPRSTPKRLKFSFSPYRKSDSTKAKQRKYEKTGVPTDVSSEHVKFSADTVFTVGIEEATPKRFKNDSLTSPAGDLTLTETRENDVDKTLIEQEDVAINEETALLLPQETTKDRSVDVSAFSDEHSVFSRLLSRISPDKFVRPLSDSNIRRNKDGNKKTRWSLPNLRLRRRKTKEEKDNACQFDSISDTSSSPEKDRYNTFSNTDAATLEQADQVSSDEPKSCNILSAKGAYLNTLNEDGRLSPYMRVIAKRYRLFDPDQRLKRSDLRFSAIDSSRLHPGYEVPYMPCTRSDTILGSSLGHIPSVRLTPTVGGILANRKGSLSHDAHLDKLVLSVDGDGLVNDLEINRFVDNIIKTVVQEIVNEASELDTNLQIKHDATGAAQDIDSILQKASELDIYLTRYIESIIETAVYICVMEKKKYQTYHPSKVSYSKRGRICRKKFSNIPQIIINHPSDDDDQDSSDDVATCMYEIGLDNFVDSLVVDTLDKITSEEIKRIFRMNIRGRSDSNTLANVAEEIEDETYSENISDNRDRICGNVNGAADDIVDLLLRRVSNNNLSISADEYDDIINDRLEKQDSNLDAHSLDRFISPEKCIVDTINQEIITDESVEDSTKEPDYFSDDMPSYSIGLLSSFENLFDAKLKDYKAYETFDLNTPVSVPFNESLKSTTGCITPDSEIVLSFTSSSTDDELMEKNLQTNSPDISTCLEQAGCKDLVTGSEICYADSSAVTVVDVDESCNLLQGSFRHFVSPIPPEKPSLKARQQNMLTKLSAFRNHQLSGTDLVPLRRLAPIRNRATIPRYRHSVHVNLPVMLNEFDGESAVYLSSDTSRLNNNQNKYCSPRTRPMSCALDGDTSYLSDASDRFLVLDRSTSVCSLRSNKTLSPSPAPHTLNMQDELVRSSISKRGRLPIWRKKHLPKESSERVELIGYRKRYEAGTPMYDIIPQLNRQLRGEYVVTDDFNNSNLSAYSPSRSKGLSPALMTPLQDTMIPHEHGRYSVSQLKTNSDNFTNEDSTNPEDVNLVDRSSRASESCHKTLSIENSIMDQNIVSSSTDKELSVDSEQLAYDEVDAACHLLNEALRGHGVDDDLSITSLISDDVDDVTTLGMFLDNSPDNGEYCDTTIMPSHPSVNHKHDNLNTNQNRNCQTTRSHSYANKEHADNEVRSSNSYLYILDDLTLSPYVESIASSPHSADEEHWILGSELLTHGLGLHTPRGRVQAGSDVQQSHNSASTGAPTDFPSIHIYSHLIRSRDDVSGISSSLTPQYISSPVHSHKHSSLAHDHNTNNHLHLEGRDNENKDIEKDDVESQPLICSQPGYDNIIIDPTNCTDTSLQASADQSLMDSTVTFDSSFNLTLSPQNPADLHGSMSNYLEKRNSFEDFFSNKSTDGSNRTLSVSDSPSVTANSSHSDLGGETVLL